MRWNAATDASARGHATSIACARKRSSVYALRWTGGKQPKPKGVNKPSKHSMMRVQVSLLQCPFLLMLHHADVVDVDVSVLEDAEEEDGELRVLARVKGE